MKKIILVFSFICLGFAVHAQQSEISLEVKEHIKARIDADLNVGIVVGYIDGDTVEYYSYGKTALTNGTDVDENSVFEIGSISKTFTAIMLAEKVIQGEMSLSDPMSKYLPESVKVPSRNGKVITLKDLATHSSGLPRLPDNLKPANLNNPYADYTIENAYSFLSSYELPRDIGETYEYSNYGMGMLGHILELQSGKSYEDLMVERIADVYGMNETRVVFTKSMKEHLAKGHANGREVENWDLPALAGAGAIRSTASDMVKYLQANIEYSDTALNKGMKLSHQVAYANEAQNLEIGLAWHLGNNGNLVLHNGGTGGYSAMAAFNVTTKKGVVVLTNSIENVDAIALKLLDNTSQLVMPKLSIARILEEEINANGMSKGIVFYKKTKQETPDAYDFGEGELNRLGYKFLGQDDLESALAIFKLNVEMFPEASNPYDSLGEVYLKKGDSTLAITNYKKSLELDVTNDNAVKILTDLGIDTASLIKEVIVPVEVLETYVGDYELAPSFIITITRVDSHLFLQATNQPQFEIFASAQNEFYLKVVKASVTFNANSKGVIDSMTLHQGGQHIPGKKME